MNILFDSPLANATHRFYLSATDATGSRTVNYPETSVATPANELLTQINAAGDDSVISPVEKPAVIIGWQKAQADWGSMLDKAKASGVPWTDFDAVYQALATYIGRHTDLLTTDVTTTLLTIPGYTAPLSWRKVWTDWNAATMDMIIRLTTAAPGTVVATSAAGSSEIANLSVNASAPSIDGVNPVDGDRVMLRHQTTRPAENGVYTTVVTSTAQSASDYNAPTATPPGSGSYTGGSPNVLVSPSADASSEDVVFSGWSGTWSIGTLHIVVTPRSALGPTSVSYSVDAGANYTLARSFNTLDSSSTDIAIDLTGIAPANLRVKVSSAAKATKVSDGFDENGQAIFHWTYTPTTCWIHQVYFHTPAIGSTNYAFTPAGTLPNVNDKSAWRISGGTTMGRKSYAAAVSGTTISLTETVAAYEAPLPINVSGARVLQDNNGVRSWVNQGSVPTFNATTAGIVPASGGGTVNFLRADGTWAAAGGGSANWGAIGGTLSAQGDLVSALASASSAATWGSITGASAQAAPAGGWTGLSNFGNSIGITTECGIGWGNPASYTDYIVGSTTLHNFRIVTNGTQRLIIDNTGVATFLSAGGVVIDTVGAGNPSYLNMYGHDHGASNQRGQLVFSNVGSNALDIITTYMGDGNVIRLSAGGSLGLTLTRAGAVNTAAFTSSVSMGALTATTADLSGILSVSSTTGAIIKVKNTIATAGNWIEFGTTAQFYVGREGSTAGINFPGSSAGGGVWWSPSGNSYFNTPAATFSGSVSMGALTAAGATFSAGVNITGTNSLYLNSARLYADSGGNILINYSTGGGIYFYGGGATEKFFVTNAGAGGFASTISATGGKFTGSVVASGANAVWVDAAGGGRVATVGPNASTFVGFSVVQYSSDLSLYREPLAISAAGSAIFASSVTGTSFLSTDTSGNPLAQNIAATTGQKFLRMANTGGDFYLGVENSAGSFFGVSAYNSVIYSPGNNLYVKTPTATFSGSVTATGSVNITGSWAGITIGGKNFVWGDGTEYYFYSPGAGGFIYRNAADNANLLVLANSGDATFTGTPQFGSGYTNFADRAAPLTFNSRYLSRSGNSLMWRYDGTNDGTILHTGNVGTQAATLQAAIASATAPMTGVFADRPAANYIARNPWYYYATDVEYPASSGQFGALYTSNGTAWSGPATPLTVVGKVVAGVISAGAVGAAAIAADVALIGQVIRSTGWTAGNTTTSPAGFKLSGAAFTTTYITANGYASSSSNCFMEIGGDANFGGYRALTIRDRTMMAFNRIVNGMFFYNLAGWYWTPGTAGSVQLSMTWDATSSTTGGGSAAIVADLNSSSYQYADMNQAFAMPIPYGYTGLTFSTQCWSGGYDADGYVRAFLVNCDTGVETLLATYTYAAADGAWTDRSINISSYLTNGGSYMVRFMLRIRTNNAGSKIMVDNVKVVC
jgi:hypothetical protein